MRKMRSAVIVRHSAASIVVVASDGQSVWNGPQTRETWIITKRMYRAISCYRDRVQGVSTIAFHSVPQLGLRVDNSITSV